MKATPAFELRSLTRRRISPTQSRVEANITNDPDVENADESVAFSLLIHHKKKSILARLSVHRPSASARYSRVTSTCGARHQVIASQSN
jgi:hypothetical protein